MESIQHSWFRKTFNFVVMVYFYMHTTSQLEIRAYLSRCLFLNIALRSSLRDAWLALIYIDSLSRYTAASSLLCESLTERHYRFSPQNHYGFYGLGYSWSWGKSQAQRQVVSCEMIACFHCGEWGEMRHGNPIVKWVSVGKFPWLVSDEAAANKSNWCHWTWWIGWLCFNRLSPFHLNGRISLTWQDWTCCFTRERL